MWLKKVFKLLSSKNQEEHSADWEGCAEGPPEKWDGPKGLERVERAVADNDQELLKKIVSPEVWGPWRSEAVGALEDQELLLEISLYDEDIGMRQGAGERLTNKEYKNEYLSKMLAWAKKRLFEDLENLEIESGNPVFMGDDQILSSDGGKKEKIWSWIHNYIQKNDHYTTEDFLSNLNANAFGIYEDAHGRKGLAEWLKRTESPHDSQNDLYYTVEVEQLFILRTGENMFRWVIRKYCFQSST